ncbi:MAG: diguanylate cyclase [Candidatus Bipolaricaulota bacterium]|nr:diguanylate cyclase [Candidatus Bipolaricaulota bacterium]
MLRWDPNTYAVALILVSVGIAAGVAPIAWQKRRLPGGWALFVLSLATFWWTFLYGLEIGAPGLHAKLWLAGLEYIGIASVPLAWFCFILQYSYHGKWLTAKRLFALTVIPIATCALLWTNQWHGVVQTSVSLDTSGPFPAIAKSFGPWFWVYYGYVALLLLSATYVLVRGFPRALRLHRQQAATLLVAVFAPWIVDFLHIARIDPIHRLDLTPIAFSASTVALVWGLRRTGLFDLLPVARDLAIREIGQGTLFVSRDLAILDANPAAQRLLGADRRTLVGSALTEALPALRGAAGLTSESVAPFHVEGSTRPGEGEVDVEIHCWPLADFRKRRIGYVVTLLDVRERKQIERKLGETGQRMVRLHEHALRLAGLERESDVYAFATTTAEREFPAATCVVYTAEGNQLETAAASILHVHDSISLSGPHVCAAAYAAGTTIHFDGPDDIPPGCAVPLPWRSGICAPMRGAGVLAVLAIGERAFQDADVNWVQLFAQHVQEAVRRIRLQEELREQARRDALTGAFNRHHFLEAVSAELARATRRNYPLAFIMIDIDEFKQVNDRLGHQTGDRVLQEIGRVLLDNVRSYDLVIRYGGDEFLLVVPESSSHEESAALLRRLQASLAAWNEEASPLPMPLTFATGVAHWHPSEGRNWEDVVEEADRTMYLDKATR